MKNVVALALVISMFALIYAVGQRMLPDFYEGLMTEEERCVVIETAETGFLRDVEPELRPGFIQEHGCGLDEMKED